jgi:alkylhydroperoxidase family enzyme
LHCLLSSKEGERQEQDQEAYRWTNLAHPLHHEERALLPAYVE